MSRFKNLQKQLGFFTAVSFYRKLKSGNLSNLRTGNLVHQFNLRNNPFDYATFEEVILNEAYNIPFGFEPKFIIDGGGNIGLTACFFASKFPAAAIITIEPDTDNYNLLQLNCKAYANIQTLQCGIWKNDTHLKIENTHAGNNAFTVIETNEAGVDTIKALTVLSVMEQFNMPHIDVLKLDIEGSEKEVFEENFEKWLPLTKVLIIELHDEMKKGCSRAVFNAINKYDFSFDTKGENIIFTNNAFK
ncbi:MAG: FkbM family methyltransferase [Chitinophagaceae bacterium]|nr:FkbM family methyltransferase [Chitinophagaceae bacterium]